MIVYHFLMKKISKTILYRVFLRFLSVFHNVKKYLTPRENGVWACNDSLTNSFSANSLLCSDILVIFASRINLYMKR